MKKRKLLALMIAPHFSWQVTMAQAVCNPSYGDLIKQHIHADFKDMYREPSGKALIYPYLTPGSKQYANVLAWLEGSPTVKEF